MLEKLVGFLTIGTLIVSRSSLWSEMSSTTVPLCPEAPSLPANSLLDMAFRRWLDDTKRGGSAPPLAGTDRGINTSIRGDYWHLKFRKKLHLADRALTVAGKVTRSLSSLEKKKWMGVTAHSLEFRRRPQKPVRILRSVAELENTYLNHAFLTLF